LHVTGAGETGKREKRGCKKKRAEQEENKGANSKHNTATFRPKGLATFLLLTLQVLGSLGFKAPNVISSEPFHILCAERVTDKGLSTHHLYLQARGRTKHAYLMYVEIGFINAKDSFLCSTYKDNCRVQDNKKSKGIDAGYTTNDSLLCLFVLRK
jgi:hypothetical protein